MFVIVSKLRSARLHPCIPLSSTRGRDCRCSPPNVFPLRAEYRITSLYSRYRHPDTSRHRNYSPATRGEPCLPAPVISGAPGRFDLTLTSSGAISRERITILSRFIATLMTGCVSWRTPSSRRNHGEIGIWRVASVSIINGER